MYRSRSIGVVIPACDEEPAVGRVVRDLLALRNEAEDPLIDEIVVCDNPEDAYKGADIVAGVSNSSVPIVMADCLEPGQHIVNVGGGTGMVDEAARERVDVYFRFGNAPAPAGLPEMAPAGNLVSYSINFKMTSTKSSMYKKSLLLFLFTIVISDLV